MISVLLPTFNAEHTISSAVRSILNQTFNNFEVLVLDDGSTDNTEKVIKIIADERLQYHRLRHQGLTKTLNYGLSIAQYDIIARMDADDLCVPSRFEKQLHILQQLKKDTILSSWYGIFDDKKLKYIVKTPSNSFEIKKGLLLHSFVSHPGIMCNKNTLLNSGGYYNKDGITAFEDYETWLKIKDKVEFHIVPEVLIFQRYRKDSLSNNILNKQRIVYAIQQPYYNNLLLHFGIGDINEQNLYRGWREYFYGNKTEARILWRKLGYSILKNPRIVLALCTTFLPNTLFIVFKESRIKYRINYRLKYFTSEMYLLRRIFQSLL